MSLNHKAIAEHLDAIAEAMSGLAGYFRAAGVGGTTEAADGPAKKPARTAAASAKPAAKGKAKADPEPDEDLSIEEVRAALKELVELRGKEVMVQALESVGAGKLADVDESQYQELMVEVERLKEEEPEEAPAPAKKTRTKKAAAKAGPTADDLLEKFKELIEADRPGAKALLKELGVAKISEVEDDDIQAAMDAVEAALADDGDDDLL